MFSEYNYHTRVMGCDFDMTFIAHSTDQADDYFTHALDIAQKYEKQFSRFDRESELSRVNREKSLTVSENFLETYAVARRLYEKTGQKFNPLVQAAKIGYDRTFDEVKDAERNNRGAKQYNFNVKDVVVAQDVMTLTDAQELDFGGFLKGHVAQKIADTMESPGGMIINIGGDMYVRGVDHESHPFTIEIVHPHDGVQGVRVPLTDKALCTSGVYKRTWKINGEKKHHIVDPGTRDSAETNVLSASVIHEDGAVADAFATLAVAVGSEEAIEFLSQQKIAYVIMCVGGDILVSNDLIIL